MPANQVKEAAAVNKQARAIFEATKLGPAQRNIHVFAGIASVCNFLFLICDIIFIQGQTERMIVAILRYCFSILLVLMVRKLQRVKTFASFAALVTGLEAAAIFLYLYVLKLYEAPNFMIQSMGLLLTILVIFIVPNRSGNMLTLALAGTAAYFLFAHFFIDSMTMNEYMASLVYVAITIVICAVKAIGNDQHARREFQAKTRLEQASAKDFLTNAATRARLEEEARRWMNFCRRQSLPLCLVFVDVDNLKQINDTYGHAMGDLALIKIAELMQNQLRNSDTVARWGGDEFVMLLPNVTLKNAVLLLDRMKLAVSRLELNDGVRLSCSFGVVQMGPETTYAQMIEEADAMMYRSKQDGKGIISYQNASNGADG